MTTRKLIAPAFNLAKWLIAFNNKLYDGIGSFIGKLNFAQKLYLLAFAILCFSGNLALVAFITVVALSAEFWPLFARVWHSLAGKAILLLFYAVVANFALAGAASVVNEVVGVSSAHFSYTHNFAILLYLPAWGLAISIIALLMLQILAPFYLTLILMLRPFGVPSPNLSNLAHYRKWTLVLRLILASILLYHLALLSDVETVIEENLDNPKLLSLNMPKEPFDSAPITDEIQANITTLTQLSNESQITPLATVTAAKETSVLKEENAIDAQASVLAENIEKDVAKSVERSVKLQALYAQKIREFIAHFAYQLEADEKSRCLITNNAHVVELNDYELLEISPNKTALYGYDFIVKRCISPAFPAKAS